MKSGGVVAKVSASLLYQLTLTEAENVHIATPDHMLPNYRMERSQGSMSAIIEPAQT